MHFLRLLVATTLLLSLLTFVPGAQAEGGQENFDDCTQLSTPNSPPGCPVDADYTYTSSLVNAFTSDVTAFSAPNSLRAIPQHATASYVAFQYPQATACSTTAGAGATSFYQWIVNVSSLPPAGSTDTMGVGSSAPGANFGISYGSTGAINLLFNGAGTSTGATMLTGQWVDFTVSQNCSTVVSANSKSCVSSNVLQLVFCTSPATVAVGGGNNLKTLNFLMQDTAPFDRVFYFDNLVVTGISEPLPDFLIQWCSDHSATDFGYDFREDVNRVTSDANIEIDPYYKFGGSSGDYGYLAKSFGGTQTQLAQFFRIESQADGANSNFRVVWSFVPATGTAENPVLNKGTGSTAGDSSGDFAQHIEVRFLEEGNDWDIRAFYVDVAGGTTSRTTLGQSVNDGNPNTPTSYVALLDTAEQRLQVYRVDDGPGTPVYIQSQSGGDPSLGQSGNVTDLILDIDTGSGAGFALNDVIESAWFVGFHTDIGIVTDVTLALDENPNTDYSTCYASSFLVDPNGDPGALPSTVVGGGDVDGPGGGDGTLFGAISDTLFMGFLLVFGVVWMGIARGAPGAAIGALFFIGLGLGYAIGWMPLWFILVLFVMSLAAVWFLPKPNQASGGLG